MPITFFPNIEEYSVDQPFVDNKMQHFRYYLEIHLSVCVVGNCACIILKSQIGGLFPCCHKIRVTGETGEYRWSRRENIVTFVVHL